ncbi:FAD-dependent oxidoreductase [Bacteroides zoogleoformans]|uniref:FAD-dependent oxidoreductase n=1 Tax=Bacteroides zoogleoformans TaxID=28119 RepID=UPI00248D9C39|nr:FAD-dependent oxidoreductase [Bacteroides zoogleoformans]
MKSFLIACLSILFTSFIPYDDAQDNQIDVLVVGGGASGVTSGIQAARMGVKALIIEETEWLGGMLTAAGVSAIDGNYNLPAGLWGELKNRLSDYYGGLDAMRTGWVSNLLFEPSAGNAVLHEMTQAEKNLSVWKQATLKDLKREGECWLAVVQTKDKGLKTVRAKVLIDATELGDVAKLCGVKYDIGMESRSDTNEDIAPEKGNNIVQDITYVAILKDYGKDVTISQPEGYDPKEFACACANPICITPKEPDRVWSKEMMLTYGRLPNNKYMINWPIEGNDYYINLVEMTPEERKKALEYAKHYTLCFVYFMQHELGYKTLGLADDEYPTTDRLPFIPYHRESRRIHGLVRFTLNHITHPYTQVEPLYRTSIAVGDYPVDHHHTRYHGYEELPNLYFHPIPSFGLPLGALIPQEVEGLIVAEKSISVSNIANGTTRLQPVVLQIGQAAGALAALSVMQQKKVSEVGVRSVQKAILDAKGYLMPYLDVPAEDIRFKSYQRIGSTGILKGVGRNVKWSNQTWLRADTLLLASELQGLSDVYPHVNLSRRGDTPVTVGEAVEIIRKVAVEENLKGNMMKRAEQVWQEFGMKNFDLKRAILRGEMAVLIDQLLDPFNNKEIDIKGQFIQ